METAGRADYAGTRAFYQARGYSPSRDHPGFLRPGG